MALLGAREVGSFMGDGICQVRVVMNHHGGRPWWLSSLAPPLKLLLSLVLQFSSSPSTSSSVSSSTTTCQRSCRLRPPSGICQPAAGVESAGLQQFGIVSSGLQQCEVLSFQKRSSERLQCTHHLFSLGCLYFDIFDSCYDILRYIVYDSYTTSMNMVLLLI
ncbi:uncharacterized protein LOC122195513 [Lactuca sativa]|uniref:uncharacterized protein LOC122195513 n=1 Tax=Lactuca sativa TaxID=4236 RepID=UPI0022AE74F6|nr:uncharacterized protein LOC122195513 [Lactuca sativa]